GAVGVAGRDRRLAADRVVGRAGQPGAPFGAGVDADLADGVDGRTAAAGLAQGDGVVAVPVGDGRGQLVGLGDDGGVGVGPGPHVAVAAGHRAGERDGLARGRGAVAVELERVPAGRQVDGGAGAVEDLDGL